MYSEKPRINYIFISFLFIQLVFVIIIVSILSNLLGHGNITTEISSYPLAHITDLYSAIPELPSEYATTIERQLYSALLVNSADNTIIDSTATATVADGSVNRNHFDVRGGVNLISASIDVPALSQSYSFFYGYPEAGNSDFQTFYTILCPTTSNTIYPDFVCNTSFEKEVTKDTILAFFLSYFNFDYFSVSVDTENSHRLIIGPSVTYNNDEKTKKNYINELKDAISSLGFNPNDYEYYVRTAADINYEQNDR